jgi:hypothetical protein
MGRRKAVVVRVPCQQPWCVALAEPDGVKCAVHRGDDAYKPLDGSPVSYVLCGDCIWCDNTGQCNECNGDGQHRCRCGYEHDCETCDGTGKCDECKETRIEHVVDPYVVFAFDAGWRAYSADAELSKISVFEDGPPRERLGVTGDVDE